VRTDSAGKLDAITLTVNVKAGESPARKSPFPPFWTAIECEPGARPFVVKVASPPLSEAVPSKVLPSLKVTVPVGEKKESPDAQSSGAPSNPRTPKNSETPALEQSPTTE